MREIGFGAGRRGFLKGVGAFAALGAPNLLAKGKDRPNLTLGVISDTHIGSRESAITLERTLKFFRDRKVDAVVCCGDLSDWGLLSGLKYIAEAWERAFPNGKGAEGRPVQKLFCTGNHDYEGWWYGDMTAEMHALGYDEDEALSKLGMKKCWEEVFQEEFAPVRKRTVNGFDFISGEWYGYDEAPGFNLAPDWIKTHVSEIDTSKPFFYFMHPPLSGTTVDSYESKLCRAVTDVLSPYPYAVSFNGHTHWTLNDERCIWQGAFTAVSVPSLSVTGVMDGDENGGDVRNGKTTRAMPMIPARFRYEEPQGLVISVFDDRMVMERYDFRKFVHTAPTWNVPFAPTVPEERPYSFKAHSVRTPVPEFPEKAKLTLFTSNTETRGGKWEIVLVASFPAAKAVPAARALDYELRAVPTDGSTPVVKRFLSPAFHKLKEDEPDRMKFWLNVLELPQDKEYRIEVYPRNCFGVCGKPLVSAPRRGKPGGASARGWPPPKKA